MRLYCTSGEDDNGMTIKRWSGTQADAGKQRKEMRAQGLSFVETDEVDFPTTKAELIHYLNEQEKAKA